MLILYFIEKLILIHACDSCFRSSPSKLVLREDVDNMPPDDDEHRLIARYTARLAADANNAVSWRHGLYFIELSNN